MTATPLPTEAELKDLDMDREDTTLGGVTWACSEEDGGPDVGISVYLGKDERLWCGEISSKLFEECEGKEHFDSDGGKFIVWYKPEPRLIAKCADDIEAREFVEWVAGLLSLPRSDTGRFLNQIAEESEGPIKFEDWHLVAQRIHDLAREALTASPSTGDGVIVPREPTEAMIEAAERRNDEQEPNSWGNSVPAPFAEIYKAMLTASPLAVSTREDEMRNAICKAVQIKARELDRKECCGNPRQGPYDEPPECCGDFVLMLSNEEADEAIRSVCFTSTPSPASGRSPAGDAE